MDDDKPGSRSEGSDANLPGWSPTQRTEVLGLLEVEEHLTRAGFKWMPVSGQFDDGLDLLVSPHDDHNVLPAVAGIQVKAGASHRNRLTVGRHQRYWGELNLPVFAVVLDVNGAQVTGGWVDAQAYLRDHAGVAAIPMTQTFPHGFGDALRAAARHQRAEAVALDVFSDDERRQATAVLSLAPLAGDPRVLKLLAAALGRLGSSACHWAVQLLAFAADHPQAHDLPNLSVEALVRAADLMYDFEFDDFDAGVLSVYRLLKFSGVAPHDLASRGLSQASGDGAVLLLAMAVSLAGPDGSEILDAALRQRPNLLENSDVQGLLEVVREGAYSFEDGF